MLIPPPPLPAVPPSSTAGEPSGIVVGLLIAFTAIVLLYVLSKIEL